MHMNFLPEPDVSSQLMSTIPFITATCSRLVLAWGHATHTRLFLSGKEKTTEVPKVFGGPWRIFLTVIYDCVRRV